MNVNKQLTKKLKDGSIKTCLDFINWLEKHEIKFNDFYYKLFYRTKRKYLNNERLNKLERTKQALSK